MTCIHVFNHTRLRKHTVNIGMFIGVMYKVDKSTMTIFYINIPDLKVYCTELYLRMQNVQKRNKKI